MKKELKKYAIACKKEEVKDVLKELHKAGFEGGPAPKDCILDVNFRGRGVINYGSNGVHDINWYVEQGTEFLTPSYVLTHAHELDGARKLEDTPPEGMRLVTDQERKDNDTPRLGSCASYAYFWGGCWSFNCGTPTDWKRNCVIYAIPADYVFPKPREIAPEGYRLVTEEEREKYKKPNRYKQCSEESMWLDQGGSRNNGFWYCDVFYAVPLDFTFEPLPIEINIEQAQKVLDGLAFDNYKIVK